MGITFTIFSKNYVFKFQNFTNLNQNIFSSFRLKSHKFYFYFSLKSILKFFFITPNFYFLFSKIYKRKRYRINTYSLVSSFLFSVKKRRQRYISIVFRMQKLFLLSFLASRMLHFFILNFSSYNCFPKNFLHMFQRLLEFVNHIHLFLGNIQSLLTPLTLIYEQLS